MGRCETSTSGSLSLFQFDFTRNFQLFIRSRRRRCRRPARVHIMRTSQTTSDRILFFALVCLLLRRRLIGQKQSQTVRKTGDEVKCMMNETFILKLQLFL